MLGFRWPTALVCALAVLALCPAAAVATPAGVNDAPSVTEASTASTDAAVRDSSGTDGTGADRNATVRIAGAYPNPVTHGDAGEFVVLEVADERSLGAYALTDGETVVDLPDETVSGRVLASTDPDLTAELLDRRVIDLGEDVRLADAGDRLELRRDGVVLDRFGYANAPEGKVATRTDGDLTWRPLGATDRPVVTAGPGTVEAFVLPDEPSVPVDFLAGAEDRLLLAGYTLTSDRVATELIAAAERGVTVRVLVDGSPVGGTSDREAATLDRLAGAGIAVETFDTDRSRYAFHHAKYAVVDDEALVTSENWKPSGVGGRANRGWGAITDQPAIVDGLVETFRADADWHDTVAWDEYERGRVVEADPPADETYPRAFEATELPVERSRLLVAPDNAEPALLELIEGAESSVRIKQVRIGEANFSLLDAAVDAARRGVEVRVLLDGTWYVEEENERIVERLRAVAEREGLPLAAKIVDPSGEFEKIHAKGLVVDERHVAVGSLNWNEHATERNREVVLVLSGADVGAYYADVFDADWRGDPWSLPVGLVVVGGVVVLLAGVVAARLRVDPAGETR